ATDLWHLDIKEREIKILFFKVVPKVNAAIVSAHLGSLTGQQQPGKLQPYRIVVNHQDMKAFYGITLIGCRHTLNVGENGSGRNSDTHFCALALLAIKSYLALLKLYQLFYNGKAQPSTAKFTCDRCISLVKF